MLDEEFYQKNLKALAQKNPFLKTLVALQPLPQKKLEPSINTWIDQNHLFEQKDLKRFFVYKMPSESNLKKLLAWKRKDSERKILFFEEKLSNFQVFLMKAMAQDMLCEPHIYFLFTQSPSFWEREKKVLQSAVNLPFKFLVPKSLDANDEKRFKKIQDNVTALCMDQNALFAEYVYTSDLVYKNALKSLHCLKKSTSIACFKNSFKKIPAIICAAGPSINSQLQQLKMVKEKALFFAGGNALSILSKACIEPHFIAAVDPYSAQEEVFSQNHFLQSPVLYRLRLNSEALKKTQGPLFYIPKSKGYPLVSWIEKKLCGSSDTHIEGGLNIVNLNVELAHFMGCDPIILVGSDLAYFQKQAYSSDCIFKNHLPKEGEINPFDFSINRGVIKKNFFGDPVYTLWKWVEEGEWLSNFAMQKNETTFIQTEKKGLFLKNFTYQNLAKTAEKHLKNTYDFQAMIHQHYQPKPHPNFDEIHFQAIQKIIESLKKSIGYLENICKAPNTLDNFELESEFSYQMMLSMLADLFERVEMKKNDRIKAQKKAKFLLIKAKTYLKLFQND